MYRANKQYNDTIFMNSENSETFASLRLLLNFSDKINLTRSDKQFSLSNLSIYTTWVNIAKSYKLKILAPMSSECLNYLMDHIVYHIFKIILKISSESKIQWMIILHKGYM